MLLLIVRLATVIFFIQRSDKGNIITVKIRNECISNITLYTNYKQKILDLISVSVNERQPQKL